MDPLATVEDVQRLGVDVSDVALVEALLESVSAAVREAAGTPITVAEMTITREGTWDQHLLLPGNPVREVLTVLLDGAEVVDWSIRAGRLYRSQGWGNSDVDVAITFTYGFDQPPADIVKLVSTFVAAGINEAAVGAGSRRGLSSVRVDDAMESYTRGADEVVDLTELPDRVKASLAARFGGAVTVSRSL